MKKEPGATSSSTSSKPVTSAPSQPNKTLPSPALPRPEAFHPTIRPPMKIPAPSSDQMDLTPASFVAPPPHLSTPPIPSSSGLRRFPSELSPREKAALDAELQQATNKYNRDIAAARQHYSDDADGLARKMTTIENGFASKKSQIRKKHGVTMRMRKSEQADRARAANESMVATPPHISPAASFSPINAPGSGSKTHSAAILPPPNFRSSGSSSRAYVASHVLPPQRQHASPYSQEAGQYRGTDNAILPPIARPINKRRSSDEEHHSPRPSGPTQTEYHSRSPWFNRTVSAPGPQMMEVRTEDAASTYTKGQAGNSRRPSMPGPHPPSSSSGGKGTRESVIVLTDSDTETDPEVVKPAPVPHSAPEEVLAPSIEKDDDDDEDMEGA